MKHDIKDLNNMHICHSIQRIFKRIREHTDEQTQNECINTFQQWLEMVKEKPNKHFNWKMKKSNK